MNTKPTRNIAVSLLALGLIWLAATVILAEDKGFAGTWKGELASAFPAAPGGRGGPGGAPGGGRGGPGGGFGGGKPQKITLRIKGSKDKASGNFSIDTNTDDIQDGKIDGNKLTFKTGLPPSTIYVYEAILNGDELSVTRSPEAAAGAPAGGPGGRGGGRPQTFKLARK